MFGVGIVNDPWCRYGLLDRTERRRRPNGAERYALNYNPLIRHAGFTPDLADILLADVAIRIQLSKTGHDKAVDRFDTMKDWIDREGSPLRASFRCSMGRARWP
jgi:hypothetical protein